MKITEVISEAHHGRLTTEKIGKWTVHLDSHAIATLPVRHVDMRDFVNILNYAFKYIPELDTIPRGKGAYFQDTNTLVSIYIRRSSSYPNEFTVETVLSPDMRPTPPLFRRPIPSHDLVAIPGIKDTEEVIRKDAAARGRDAIAQDLETASTQKSQPNDPMDNFEPVNRQQRRAFDRWKRKQGL